MAEGLYAFRGTSIDAAVLSVMGERIVNLCGFIKSAG